MKSSSNIVGPKTLDYVGQSWMSILNTVKSDATSPTWCLNKHKNVASNNWTDMLD